VAGRFGSTLDSDIRLRQYIHIGYIKPGYIAMAPGDSKESAGTAAFLPLTPAVFHIMLALADGESHGYGLMLEVDQITKGRLRLGPGTLYRSIQRMLVDGLIVERKDAVDPENDDERRRYYRLTKLGLDVARAESRRLEALVRTARRRGLLSKPVVAGRRA
jgi:DNA-binding PadR family transcriptional regulator